MEKKSPRQWPAYLVVLAILAGVIVLSTQRTDAPLPPPPPPTPVETTPWAKNVVCDKIPWQDAWNEHISKAIDDHGPQLLDGTAARAEIILLCPHYFETPPVKRKAFWGLFFASLACPESGFKPTTMYWEAAMTKPKWSEGLYQLSYGDEKGHKKCEIVKTGGDEYSKTNPAKGNIHDPRINIRCAVAIMDNQLRTGKGLFQSGKPYYWSVLNNNGPKVKSHYWKYASQLAPVCGPK